ncbi:MAG: N-acetylmuramoyl-L-alanine amidase [bacterium]|nr:N-acetylmuramoyl-L-alanine amidase [bacterium]
MLKIILTSLTILLMTGTSLPAADTEVFVSGGKEKIDRIKIDRVEYVSLSQLVEILGGRLDWVIVGHKVSYLTSNNRFEFLIDAPYFRLNDSTYNMTFPAQYFEGDLYVYPETFFPYLDRVLAQKITYSSSQKSIRIDSDYFNVSDLAISAKANGLLMEIFLTGEMAYEIFVTEGNWINVSIRDGKLNSSKILSRRDSRYMYRLKTHQADGSGQISMRMKRPVKNWHHKLAFDPPRIQISIADAEFSIDTAETNAVIGPDDKIDVIVIDAGHGGSDYGAIGRGGTREKDVSLSIARELAKLIRKDKQFKVIMTRDRDKTVTLEQRAQIANQAAADLFVSIHANSSVKRRVRGWNVFFLAEAKNDSARSVEQLENSAFLKEGRDESDNGNEDFFADPILSILNDMLMTEFQAESHDFALMCDREMRRNLDIPARGVDQAGFYVLNKVFTPSVLIESGFISNKTEENLLKDGKYQKKVAEALYKAIKRFRAKYEST